MAKITLDLSRFKASGIYTLEFDASESIILNTQTVRLIVGFSRKGPFNAPVYLPDKKTAKRVFGEIDPKLERRGSYFHRAIYTALEVGPVFGLNLMPLNNDPDFGDKVPYTSYSLSTTEENGQKTWKLLASFYNKERFWYPDAEYFLANVNTAGSINTGKLFNVVNLGQVPFSIMVRKATVLGFDITAREWFGKGKVPSFIDDWDFISDYFLEVTIVQGNWTDYKSLSVDPVFSEYFDTRGLKKDKLDEFLGAPEVSTLGIFSGSIIPDLVDGEGINHSLDTIINQSIASTGLFVSVDRETLEEYDPFANTDDTDNYSAVDLIGHNFANPNRENPDIIDFLSYKTAIKEKMNFLMRDDFTEETYSANAGDDFEMESVHLGRKYGKLDNVLSVPEPLSDGNLTALDYETMKNLLIPGQSLVKTSTGNWAKVEQIYEEESTVNSRNYLKIVYSHPSKADEDDIVGIKFTADATEDAMNITVVRADVPASELNKYDDDNNGYPSAGQNILIENKDTNTWFYAKVKSIDITKPSTEVTEAVFNIENSSGLENISSNLTGYKVYWGVEKYIDFTSDVDFVYQPDKVKFNENNGDEDDPNTITAYKYSKLYKYYDLGALNNGDKWYFSDSETDYYYLNYEKTIDADGVPIVKVTAYDTFIDDVFAHTSGTAASDFNVSTNYVRGVNTDYDHTIDGIFIYCNADELFDPVQIVSWNTTKTKFQLDEQYGTKIQVGHYIIAQVKDENGDSTYKLTKVVSKRKVYNQQLDGNAFEYTVNQPVQVTESGGFYFVTRYYPIDDFINHYQLDYLDGFKIGEYHLPGGKKKSQQLNKILSVLDPINSNLLEVLKDRDVITFRYIVDTFDGGLDPSTGPKVWLTRLAKERQKCLAIMNAPSITEFIDSNDPRFTEEPTKVDPKPILNTRYIADGGNLSLGPSKTFSLPDEFWGSKFSGYFSPFLVIRENGRNMRIPPAAHVSNLFVQKFINGSPFSIVAGPRRGVISEPKLVGLEYEFLQKDREYLEPFGFNPIIKKKGVGYMIYANQMAYQKTNSAFNNLHVRDLLITIEEAVEDILANYLFEFNDSSTRLEIKTIVETYLDGIRSAGGIYNFVVIMDESNNTPEIIDQNMGIIDVAIEPARGIHKFINRITVQKTGGIASGGFSFV